ncbi:Acetyl esterase/lipase [Planctomycetales bacterium 10988]|nr:Acetyl esterase/lipase [Planctomycetales bacterium 10988]
MRRNRLPYSSKALLMFFLPMVTLGFLSSSNFAQKLPPNFEGKPPKNFRELGERLKPMGFEIKDPEVSLKEGIKEQKDVTFVKRGDRAVKLDLYTHEDSTAKRPCLVIIHGGGWVNGDKEKFRVQAVWFANHGYVVANINYRLAGEARFPAGLNDCEEAIRWLRRNADKYHLDPQKIALFGGSAGAHLAALLAAKASHPDAPRDQTTDVSCQVQAAVIVAGPTDTTNQKAIEGSRRKNSGYQLFLGGSYDEMPEVYRDFSPLHWASKKTPPMLLIGENNADQFEAMEKKLKKHGVLCERLLLTGTLHGSWHREPWYTVTNETTDRFLRHALNLPHTP